MFILLFPSKLTTKGVFCRFKTSTQQTAPFWRGTLRASQFRQSRTVTTKKLLKWWSKRKERKRGGGLFLLLRWWETSSQKPQGILPACRHSPMSHSVCIYHDAQNPLKLYSCIKKIIIIVNMMSEDCIRRAVADYSPMFVRPPLLPSITTLDMSAADQRHPTQVFFCFCFFNLSHDRARSAAFRCYFWHIARFLWCGDTMQMMSRKSDCRVTKQPHDQLCV